LRIRRRKTRPALLSEPKASKNLPTCGMAKGERGAQARNILGGWANRRRLYELGIHAQMVVKFSWFG